MKRITVLLLVLLIFQIKLKSQIDSLIIQENDIGLCTYNGNIVTSSSTITGWTGPGFIDADNGIGVAISWGVFVQTEGVYYLTWRYAFGGTATNLRDGKLIINGSTIPDTVIFPYTGSWSNWMEISPVPVLLLSGYNNIRLVAVRTGGLANIDYLKIYGNGVASHQCVPQYRLVVTSNDTMRGYVSYSPVQELYNVGTVITLYAFPKSGYFLQSWMGDVPSADSVFSFAINRDIQVTARFLPNFLKNNIDTTIIGYATVQDDKGTPFLMTGGAEGDTVDASSLSELKSYLGSSVPYVVKFTGKIVDSSEITVKSNKTLLGVGELAHLQGVGLSINQACNVIIRNITISHVHPQDAIEINGASKNIVIDHCEFYSDREHGTDYYDGLLDIKNQSSFITVSRCAFHDHYKTILISSGDEQYADTVIRVTFHHNYFFNCQDRLPSIRFGKAHIFNNYFYNCHSAINTRMGACVRVEKNYFQNVTTAVMAAYSITGGMVNLIDNFFGTSNYITEPVCELEVPYSYENHLDSVINLPFIVPDIVRITSAKEEFETWSKIDFDISINYPNPFNPATSFRLTIPKTVIVKLKIYDILGKEVATLLDEEKQPGTYTITWNANDMPNGVYYCQFIAGKYNSVRKVVLIK